MVDLKIFPQKIFLSKNRLDYFLYYSIKSQINDQATLVAYNPFYAQCVAFDRENLFLLKNNQQLNGKIFIDLGKAKPFKEMALFFEIRTVRKKFISDRKKNKIVFLNNY